MFPRALVDAGDFAFCFFIHLSMSETAHHDLKSPWKKWERAVSTHRQETWWWGACLRRRIEHLQCAQSPLIFSMASFSGADPEKLAFELNRQEGFRYPRLLQEVSQRGMQEGEVTEDRGVGIGKRGRKVGGNGGLVVGVGVGWQTREKF